MLMTGLKKQSNSFFGDAIDSGATFQDSVDGAVANNWSGAIFRAGQQLGTDWWVGGTSSEQNRALLLKGFGDAAGTLDSFMGTSNGYTNQNLINFTNQFGGLVQMTVAMDSTTAGRDGVYHSLLVAGHSGGHLRTLDPWGRAYLVDINVQTRDSVFITLNSSLFQLPYSIIDSGNGQRRRISIPLGPQNLSWEIPASLTAGAKIPSWFFTLPNQSTYLNSMQSFGYITLVHKVGDPVPTLKHLSGDQGFVYYSPSQQAQLLPGTEVAAVNPGQGVYFDAAESQNNLDMLYGFGQRIRAFSYVTQGREPSDAEFARATQTIQSLDGWIGASLQSSGPKETADSIQKRLTSVTGVDPSSEVITTWLGTGLLGNTVAAAAQTVYETISRAYQNAYGRSPTVGEINRWMVRSQLSYQEISVALDQEKTFAATAIVLNYILDEKEDETTVQAKLASVTGLPAAGSLVTFWLNTGLVGQILLTEIKAVYAAIQSGYSAVYERTPLVNEVDRWMATRLSAISTLQNSLSLEKQAIVTSIVVSSLLMNKPPSEFSYSSSSYRLRKNQPMSSLAPSVQGDRPFLFSVNQLPNGLSLNSQSGVLSGTPTALNVGGAASIIKVSNFENSVTTSVTFFVLDPVVLNFGATNYTFKVGSTILPIAPGISVYAFWVPTNYSVTPSLPAGLKLNSLTGEITGSPTGVTAATSYRIRATKLGAAADEPSYVEQALSISVAL